MQMAAEDDFHTILLQEMVQAFSWFRLRVEIIAARFIQVFEEKGVMHKQNSGFARRPCEFALEEVPHFLLLREAAPEQRRGDSDNAHAMLLLFEPCRAH